MLKQLWNLFVLEFDVIAKGPVLVKTGSPRYDSEADMQFVRTRRNGTPVVYLPGSSLKGVFRSHAERICRTLREDLACNPFPSERNTTRTFCGKRLEKQDLDVPTTYKRSCPVCRIFGNTAIAGRIQFHDAYPQQNLPTEMRDGVGIDRFTGGASGGAKFNLEVVTEGSFHTRIELSNFELWQLALLGYILRDFEEGLVGVGMGKSRGLGDVSCVCTKANIRYNGAAHFPPIDEQQRFTELRGVANCGSVAPYGFLDAGTYTGVPMPLPLTERDPLAAIALIEGHQNVRDLLRGVANEATGWMVEWPSPEMAVVGAE